MLLEYHMESDTVLGLPTVKDQTNTHLNMVKEYFHLLNSPNIAPMVAS